MSVRQSAYLLALGLSLGACAAGAPGGQGGVDASWDRPAPALTPSQSALRRNQDRARAWRQDGEDTASPGTERQPGQAPTEALSPDALKMLQDQARFWMKP